MISKKDVEYVANLARISFNDKELEKLTRELEDIIKFINKLNKVDVSGVEPMSHVLHLSNVFREDKVRPSLPAAEVIKKPEIKQGLPALSADRQAVRQGNFFKVPRVIE